MKLRIYRASTRPWNLGTLWLAIIVLSGALNAFEEEFQPLMNASCIACHSNEVLSQLNLLTIEYDLSKVENYRKWERIYERVERGEMPPAPMPVPDASILDPSMSALKQALTEANLAKRGEQRVPLRRLTRLEYQYTIQDLLDLDADVAKQIANVLPAEADTGGFDTVAAKQGVSAIHVRGYMKAAQDALDAAIQVGPRPRYKRFKTEYAKSGYVRYISSAKILGGGITKIIPGGVVSIFDTASTYIFHSASEGFNVITPGRYQVTIEAFPYQANSPVTLTLYKGDLSAGGTAALSQLIGTYDLTDPDIREFSVATFLEPGDVVSPSVADHQLHAGAFKYFQPDQNIADYGGEGIAFRSLSIEGPLLESWPPYSTQHLLVGVDFENNEPLLRRPPEEHVREIVAEFGKRAFRRPLTKSEIEGYASLAQPLIEERRSFVDIVRVPLNAILTSPSFLFLRSGNGELDSFAIASRLSYLLWRSMPDEELLDLASENALHEPSVRASQIERMLADAKSTRFVKDFVGQAYRIYEMHATTPDSGLYPEFDDRLSQAMRYESEMFFAELIKENLGVRHLVDADFTFVNRRLAEHYRIPGIQGQAMRKVTLPEGHVRGGLLAQAAIHKITANGTTTSPVPRGNFVLTNLLGQPAPPPPPNVAGLEPDTRGSTTIREQLDAHRSNTVCASCHLSIDPPGFALESFDPIGGFRSNYRATGRQVVFNGETYPGRFTIGLAVDASGVTPEGDTFDDFVDYIQLLQDKKLKYIARNYVSQLIVMATGAEVEFADRDALDAIVSQSSKDDYSMRGMIHAVAQSELFRSP